MKEGGAQQGWLANFVAHPWLWCVPALGLVLPMVSSLASARERPRTALLASGGACASMMLTIAIALFPFVLPSSLDPSSSLTLWDSTQRAYPLHHAGDCRGADANQHRLHLWVYRVVRGKMSAQQIRQHGHSL